MKVASHSRSDTLYRRWHSLRTRAALEPPHLRLLRRRLLLEPPVIGLGVLRLPPRATFAALMVRKHEVRAPPMARPHSAAACPCTPPRPRAQGKQTHRYARCLWCPGPEDKPTHFDTPEQFTKSSTEIIW